MREFYDVASFAPQRSIGYLVKRLGKLSTSQIEARFVGRELTMTHWIALAMIRYGIAANCAGLARHIGHDSGATTRLVDQLEAKGLVARQRGSDDRRVVTLVCTDAGLEQLQVLTPLLLDVWNRALSDFDAAEIETLIGLLARLVETFEGQERSECPGLQA